MWQSDCQSLTVRNQGKANLKPSSWQELASLLSQGWDEEVASKQEQVLSSSNTIMTYEVRTPVVS